MSYPRSGHTYLAALLRAYFGPEFHYSAVYPHDHEDPRLVAALRFEEDRAHAASPHFLKSHDFDLTDEIVPGSKYLISVRDFFDATQSWNSWTGRENSSPYIRSMLHTYLPYYAGFMEKWVIPEALPDGCQRCVVHYLDLMHSPKTVLHRVVEYFGVQPEPDRIWAVVEDNPPRPRRQNLFYL
jgi:hypothetical protein